MVRGLALAFGAVIAVQQLGVDVSILTTVVLVLLGGAVAAAALAFGLGGQTVVANILVMHYVRRTFRSGDLLKVGEFEGRLVRTTPLAVVLEQEGREIVVPAQRFISEVTHRIPDSEV
jgi:small-conductance mechanosensitive channel